MNGVDVRHLLLALSMLGVASAIGVPDAWAQDDTSGSEEVMEGEDPNLPPDATVVPLTPEEEALNDQDLGPVTYDPEGRRDPFRPLTGQAAGTELRAQYEGMLKGRLLQEVRLTSIVRTPRGNIATFEGGPDKQGYFARVGDEFWDGVVQEINFDNMTVVVRQKLDDPRLIKNYRDVIVQLYSEEEREQRNRRAEAAARQP